VVAPIASRVPASRAVRRRAVVKEGFCDDWCIGVVVDIDLRSVFLNLLLIAMVGRTKPDKLVQNGTAGELFTYYTHYIFYYIKIFHRVSPFEVFLNRNF
jgi:hypothetical protein